MPSSRRSGASRSRSALAIRIIRRSPRPGSPARRHRHRTHSSLLQFGKSPSANLMKFRSVRILPGRVEKISRWPPPTIWPLPPGVFCLCLQKFRPTDDCGSSERAPSFKLRARHMSRSPLHVKCALARRHSGVVALDVQLLQGGDWAGCRTRRRRRRTCHPRLHSNPGRRGCTREDN